MNHKMNKIAPKTYPHVEMLETSALQKELLILLGENHCNSFREELDYVLDSFYNLISSADTLGGCNNYYSMYHDDINATIKSIKNCVKKYLFGDIYSSYNTFYHHWLKLHDRIDNSISKINSDSIYYKIRITDEKRLCRKDIFHIPFNKRGLIGNNRFSISGYPCLYLGRSIYTCWEELRRPIMNSTWVTAFKFKKEMKVLDLRLCRDINTLAEEDSYYMLLPYILASSIRTHEENVTFKPEYIIPQILLHSVVKSKHKRYSGVLYTSTRRFMNTSLDGIYIYDNLAIPVMSNRSSEHCKVLATFLQMTEPICFEHELLKGNIEFNTLDKGCSLFSKFKDYLNQQKFYNILN